MGEFNQAALLEAIRLGGGTLTRADLARVTGLSAQTVTNIVRRLLEQEIVTEAVQRQHGVGRPGTTLRIVPDSRYAVGVHLDPAAVDLVLLDLAGTVVRTRTVPVPDSERPEEILDVVTREVSAIVRRVGVDHARLLGVGVATPGPIDRTRGLVLDPPHMTKWRDVPLRDAVARRTGLPTVMDKDVFAVAAATLWYPRAGRPSDAAVVYAGTGIAIGVISGGEVIRGLSGNGGDAGHLKVGRPFGPCSCGRPGCLGGVLNTSAIVANALERGIPIPSAGDHPEAIRAGVALNELRRLAQANDAATLTLLDDMGNALGAAVTTVCDLCDLDTVVASGPVWQQLGQWMEPGLLAVLDTHYVPGKHGLHLVTAGGGDHVTAIGAACLVLEDALRPRPTRFLLPVTP